MLIAQERVSGVSLGSTGWVDLEIVDGTAVHDGINPGEAYSRLVIEAARAQVRTRPKIQRWLDALPANFETYG